jgi:hypothetical protein
MYTNGNGISHALTRASNAFDTAEDLSASNAVYGQWLVGASCTIKRIKFYVTTAIVAGTTAPQVSFKKYSAYNVSSGAVTLGTLIIPTATAVGKIVYKDITPYDLAPGQALVAEQVVQAADSGTAAGAGFYMFDYDSDPEYVVDETKMVKSA